MQNSERAGKNSSQEALGRHKAQKGSVGEGHMWDRKQWDTKDGILLCSPPTVRLRSLCGSYSGPPGNVEQVG